ncbi:MAG: HD domain-containing protein [Bdellovibrionales bacterium]|nr:HD domain-containing protein [Bdellovibrionales bacterium]
MSDTSKQFVKDLSDKDQIKSVFLAADKVSLSDRNGKRYLSVNLKDSSGSINARIWDNVDKIEPTFNSGDFVWVKGHVQVYQNRKQVVVHDLKPAGEEEVNLSDFVKESALSPDVLKERLEKYVKSIQDVHIRTLLENVFADDEIRSLIMKAPAAKSIHHAYMGGLLEHVISICDVMEKISDHYPMLNRDLLIFGAIFHDIGKVYELKIESGIQYTSKGRLVGHMGIACEFIDRFSESIDGFPDELNDILKHIVLSHHGRLEYGSPKLPAFPEAVVVNMIDDLDSKLNTIFGYMQAELEGGESWTRYHQGFDRYFYLDIFKKQLKNESDD